ncbi:hypothetical protein Thiowin_03459 [Thiorhodovibrio winogradskyi]|uniref:Uncharacterized protein n=1 Tax=Thiorhodovibrio winogradskyi TaxID=77007 RepID=A0ABZ0SDJ3_9GAMM
MPSQVAITPIPALSRQRRRGRRAFGHAYRHTAPARLGICPSLRLNWSSQVSVLHPKTGWLRPRLAVLAPRFCAFQAWRGLCSAVGPWTGSPEPANSLAERTDGFQTVLFAQPWACFLSRRFGGQRRGTGARCAPRCRDLVCRSARPGSAQWLSLFGRGQRAQGTRSARGLQGVLRGMTGWEAEG